MPAYEYQCEQCGKIIEVFQGMSDPPLETCPCDGCKGQLARLVSAGAGLIFKGSGFYITDHRKKTETAERKADKETSDKTAKSESVSSASKDTTPSKPAE